MTRFELRRIAQMYGVTEADVREAEHEAVRHPLVRLRMIGVEARKAAVSEDLDPERAHQVERAGHEVKGGRDGV